MEICKGYASVWCQASFDTRRQSKRRYLINARWQATDTSVCGAAGQAIQHLMSNTGAVVI